MTETAPGGEQWDRRAFLRAAGALAAGAAGAAAAGCDAPGASRPAPVAPPGAGRARDVALDRATLAAVGEVVLPGELGAAGRAGAVDAFVAWVAGYAPVAERMHGYGYADVRYLPPDPAPGWGAQLDGLELLARRSRGASFAALPIADRRALVESALASTPGDRLPAPIAAGLDAQCDRSASATCPAAMGAGRRSPGVLASADSTSARRSVIGRAANDAPRDRRASSSSPSSCAPHPGAGSGGRYRTSA